MSGQGSPARDRVCRFLAAREGMRGIDRDLIHAIGTHDGPVELTVSDLAAILTEGAAAVETVGRISDAIDDMPHTRDCAWWDTPRGEDTCDCIRGHLRDVLDDAPPQPDAAQVAEPAP